METENADNIDRQMMALYGAGAPPATRMDLYGQVTKSIQEAERTAGKTK